MEHFSLYSREPDIDITFNDGVFCLAGANGLGKSTFLAALNFGITGVVAEPGRSFTTVPKWHRDSQPYSESFFKGRIKDKDVDLAQITVDLSVGDRLYRITRSPFEAAALTALDIVADDGESIAAVAEADRLSDSDRHKLYERQITADCGLDEFAQLAFLQHFILTFDEQRRLIFWDEDVARTALYMVFGIDAKRASRADTLASKISKADSRARNLQWQSSDLRRQLKNMEKVGEEAEESDLLSEVDEEHRDLVAEQEEAVRVSQRLANELTDLQLRIAEQSGELRSARQQYDDLWQQSLHGHGHPKSHPVVTQTLATHHCSVCNAEGSEVVKGIEEALKEDTCPLCESNIRQGDSQDPEDLVSRLAEVDGIISGLQESLAASEKVAHETSEGLDAARRHLETISLRIDKFEQENELAIARRIGGAGGLDAVAERYRAQIADLQARKREARAQRDKDREELNDLQRELVAAYAEAEREFVPAFTGLAREFLGLDLTIELVSRSAGPLLLVSVEGSRRRGGDELSESQRFFLDIALRMALARQLSASGGRPCLYIDTPEGSLDIAYEARAGAMFALFVQQDGQLVMTANINTSQLLHRLAESCGPDKMQLTRMTQWTVLSDVQAEEEDLFDQAYGEIEASLNSQQ